MQNNLLTQTIEDITVRIRTPEGAGLFPVILLLHGWTGDENSMWIFTQRLPQNAMWISPRGIYPAPKSGFSWQARHSDGRPWIDDFQPAIDRLLGLLTPENFPLADFKRMSVIGFSQGAALTYTFGMLHPALFQTISGLSGFMPEGAFTLVRDRPLDGKRVFVAHGTRDDMVPVERARQSVATLQEAGAEVSYCEDDVGHKLSITCYKGLENFLARYSGA